MQHAYFGELDTSDQDGRDVVWEAERTLGDQTIEVLLWADADQALNEADLDAFATLVQDLPAHILDIIRLSEYNYTGKI